jgi:thymidylate kinase
MKLLIIEGTDRTGKDTLIKSLMAKYPNSEMVHWGYPVGDTNDEKTEYQKMSFGYLMRWFKFKKIMGNLDLLIWNRSHIGEYVYGTIYRDSYPQLWIPELEDEFLKDDKDVYLVLLQADAEFIVSQEDGKSYSDRLEDKQLEIAKFEEAFNNSIILNKTKIKVNNGNEYNLSDEITEIVKRAADL